MESTWESRDLPVLEAAVTYLEKHALDSVIPEGEDLARMTGLSEADIGRALLALRGEYLDVDLTGGGPAHWAVHRARGTARQAVDQWPTPDTLADRLVQALNAAANREPDLERRGWLRKAAGWLGGAGRDVAIEVAGAVLARSTGLG